MLAKLQACEQFRWVESETQIRLREKTADKLTTVFRNESVMEKYTMFDGKEIGIQVVTKEEALEEENEQKVLLMVKIWRPDSWELGPNQELFVSRESSLHELAEELVRKGLMENTKTIECAKISSAWIFHRV